jgi:hypothetical protein
VFWSRYLRTVYTIAFFTHDSARCNGFFGGTRTRYSLEGLLMSESLSKFYNSTTLPRRDYVLIPVIAMFSVLIMIAVPEVVFNFVFYEQSRDACLVPDAVLGHKALPDCVSHYKLAESPWIENRYNDCGYRTKESCGPKPTGAVRGAVLGSSIAAGYMVPYDDSFSALTAENLTKACHRPVEFQNLGGVGYQWDRLYARVDEALALKPDFVILVVTAFDLLQPQGKGAVVDDQPRGVLSRAMNAVREAVSESSIWFAAQYYRGQDTETSLRIFLRGRDRSGYLRQPFLPVWQNRIDALLNLIGRIGDQTDAAHVPLFVVYVPDRPQALLLRHANEFPDVVPRAIDTAISRFVTDRGYKFVDLDDSLAVMHDATSLFYIVNDHLTTEGHALLAADLTSRLLADDKTAFDHCNMQKFPGNR